MKNLFKRNSIDFVFVALAVVAITVPFLGYLQFTWIREISLKEKEDIISSMELTGMNIVDKITQELIKIHDIYTKNSNLNFNKSSLEAQIKAAEPLLKSAGIGGSIADIRLLIANGEKLALWNNKTNSFQPDYSIDEVRAIIEADLMRGSRPGMNRMIGKFDIMYLPIIYNEEDAALLINLNFDNYFRHILDNFIKSFFSEESKLQPEISILNMRDSTVIYSNIHSKGSRIVDLKQVYLRIPIGMIPPSPIFRDSLEDRVGRRNIFREPKNFPPFGNQFMKRGRMRHFEHYNLIFNLNTHSLNEKISKITFYNTLISFLILFILTTFIVLFSILLKRKEKILWNQFHFISGISHEYRTPLTIIRGAAENLADGIPSKDAKAKQYGKMILGETDKLSAMIENALSYTGIQNKLASKNFSHIDVESLITKSIELNRLVGDTNDIEISISPDTSGFVIFGDKTSLLTALHNIIANSIKYNKPNGRVEISASAKGKYISIFVKDTGIGISGENLSHIFEPFFRSPQALQNNIPGNGIGLTIVKKIIEFHKGKITVTSELDKGTEVEIMLPASYEK
ncbi:MAG: two-component system, OmpR family, phosphate regulon sensor histidine kinase PhoR [Bacteroidota bacterium]|nr:two-component system, OmpR family, phosphate regulon sensor histidine kinase PhoR [Bacteroidota bacterium]